MASSLVNSSIERTGSRRSHSWWWDSHISPKNSKWLSDNLDEMDQSVKRMLELIEEEGESFAEKAEIVYEKRPALTAQVEEFYRTYRSLAERYDHLLVELRKNAPSDFQSQGTFVSDLGSESLDSHDQREGRHKSCPRAAGFQVFLGLSSVDTHHREGDESSSLTDYEPHSDDSSVNSYTDVFGKGGDLRLKGQHHEMKEKPETQKGADADESWRGVKNTNGEHFTRIAQYEEKMSIANNRIVSLEEEIARLNAELQKTSPSEVTDGMHVKERLQGQKDLELPRTDGELDITSPPEDQENNATLEAENSCPEYAIQSLEEELRFTKEKLWDAEKEIENLREELDNDKSLSSTKLPELQNQLELANNEIAAWKAKHNAEKREVAKLQEMVGRLKTSLLERDHEVWDLRTELSAMEQKIFPEKAEIKAEICNLLEERNFLVEQVREWEPYSRYLEEEIKKARAKRAEVEERLNSEVNQLKGEIAEIVAQMKISNKSLDALRADKDMLNAKVLSLEAEVSSRDVRINEVKQSMDQVNAEKAELVTRTEEAYELVEDWRLRAKYLEEEVESQRVTVLEVAEEKKEVIRQLSFSIEYHRSRYQRLQRAFKGH